MAMIAIGLASAACAKRGPGLAAEDPDAWIAPCEDALARAAAGPPWRAARTIVDACRPCGVAWDPVIARPAPAPGAVIAVVDACHLDCPKTARAAFFAAISALDEDSSARQAWRGFATACPAVFAGAGADDRYAGGAWFALSQIARRLPASAHAITFALPAWSQTGTGLSVPIAPASAQLEGLGDHERLVTVTEAGAFADETPRATLAPGALRAFGVWPGHPVDHALGASYAIVAPVGLPAARLAEVVRTLGRPEHLAVTVADGTLFGGELAGLAPPPGWTPPATGTVEDVAKALESPSP